MYKLPVRDGEEEGEDDGEVQFQEEGHGCGAAQHEQEQACKTGEEEERDQAGAELLLAGFGDGGILAAPQRVKAGWADQESEAANGAEDHRQTEVAVRGLQVEHEMIESRDR